MHGPKETSIGSVSTVNESDLDFQSLQLLGKCQPNWRHARLASYSRLQSACKLRAGGYSTNRLASAGVGDAIIAVAGDGRRPNSPWK